MFFDDAIISQMTSTERILEYIDLKPEEILPIHQPVALPLQWPIGSITFENLSFRYSLESPWVLNNINISIRPGEKVIFEKMKKS